jgi:hypothetical protein
MKLFRIITLALCLQAPLAVAATESKPQEYNLAKDSSNFINQFNALSNKGVHVVVGGFAALCSCLVVKKGTESACSGEKVKRSTLLAGLGLLALAASINFAINN